MTTTCSGCGAALVCRHPAQGDTADFIELYECGSVRKTPNDWTLHPCPVNPPPPMIVESEWREFVDAGLSWWVNRGLHLFGWALVRKVDGLGRIIGVFPAKVQYRGFDAETEERGFNRLTNHLAERMGDLCRDVELTPPPPTPAAAEDDPAE